MINFTDCKVEKLYNYGGANGSKIGINYNNEIYMLKFPTYLKGKKGEYASNVYSEYISCHILEMLGFNVQKTILGKYIKNNKEKVVVACKDFLAGTDFEFVDFASIKNTIIDSLNNGYGTDLKEVLETINEQTIYPSEELRLYFWQLFIVDALLGNFDRHNGNWGFLVNKKTSEVKLAPIFDCGSCLYPQLSDEQMENYLNNQDEIDKRIYVFPNSALRENDNQDKINYYDFISNLKDKECIKALKIIVPKINITSIFEFIDGVLEMSEVRREFYKLMIKERFEKILCSTFNKVVKDNF